MVECRECGREIEVRERDGEFTVGCWARCHDIPDAEDIGADESDYYPITGLTKATETSARESFMQYWGLSD